MRVVYEAPYTFAEPMVAPRVAVGVVHALLNDRPVAIAVEQKDGMVDLVAVLQRVVIDLGRKAAGLYERRRVEPQPLSGGGKLGRRLARGTSFSTSDDEPKLLLSASKPL